VVKIKLKILSEHVNNKRSVKKQTKQISFLCFLHFSFLFLDFLYFFLFINVALGLFLSCFDYYF
jgi:hypothetical protein